MKPFRPPLLIKESSNAPATTQSEPPLKKRRIDDDDCSHDHEVDADLAAKKAAAKLLKKPAHQPKQKAAQRLPLVPISRTNSSSQSQPPSQTAPRNYYTVLWRKFTTKKNKTWDGDGVLTVDGSQVILQNVCGRELGRGVHKGPLLVGSELNVGNRDVQLESMISGEDYVSGRVFLGNAKSVPGPPLNVIDGVATVSSKAQAKHDKIATKQKDFKPTTGAVTSSSKAAFKAPLLKSTVQVAQKHNRAPVPRHNPDAQDALVMRRPSRCPKDKQIVDVVIDPMLTKALRPHQRDGVSFLYECVMGMKNFTGEGAILADAMGLGKTLQTITLLWTLLKQNPIHDSQPIIKKALIVCPVSVIPVWRKEFRKWLGNERIGVFVPEHNKMRLTDFTKGRAYQVMIIGYEKLTKVKDQLSGDCGIDIVIADEGHRLKTANNKAAAAIKSIATDRRIILSGTPMQNDLEEFYQMVDFVNPNIMNKYSAFKREFEMPILKSRQPGATRDEIEKGEARGAELSDLTSMFILRRPSEILDKYLPPKTEYIVFCRPTKVQADVYRMVVNSHAFHASISTQTAVLGLINVLKQTCNSPSLLLKIANTGNETTTSAILENISPSILKSPGASGKLQVLDSLLHQIRHNTSEKVVLISNYTATLDFLGIFLTSMEYSYIRLDGSTPKTKRQSLIDRFNTATQSNAFVFLLSTKAGGTGINLYGASRLILFDSDWNPASDLQAMARVHRDGQKRPCFVYRLLLQGAMDEKIFQRQVSKIGLADSVVDGKANVNGFTQAELRDLFTFDEGDDCQTHRLLGCTCSGDGLPLTDSATELAAQTQASRNDLARLSEEDEVEIIRLDFEDDVAQEPQAECTSTKPKRWIDTARDYDPDAVGAAITHESRGGKMMSLMQYTHFDTSRAGEKVTANNTDQNNHDGVEIDESQLNLVDDAIEDDALRNVVEEPGRRVGYIFAKLSG